MSESIQVYDPIEESSMSLMEHLKELRVRLMWVVGALVLGTLLSMIFARGIVAIIVAPVIASEGGGVQALSPTESIVVFFKVAFVMGAAFAMPVIIYQIIAFVSPGLYPKERRALLFILPGIMILFVTGSWFAYAFLLPTAVQFLQDFLGDIIDQDWGLELYVTFVTRIVFWIGVAFETPLAISFLARIGLVSGRQLLGWWRQAIVIAAIVAAMITPTIDPMTMTVVMGPLIVLYFLSVGHGLSALQAPHPARLLRLVYQRVGARRGMPLRTLRHHFAPP